MATSSFDWELTLKQCNHKKDLAEELIEMLRKDLPKTQHALQSALKKEDSNRIYIEIHKLHGSCAYCGMPKLKELISILETQIQEDTAHDLVASVSAINKEIEQVQKDLKQLA